MTTVHYAFVPSPEHVLVGHPESPLRFRELDGKAPLDLPLELKRVQPAKLNDDDLAQVHDRDYIRHLRRSMREAPGILDHGDTYFTAESLRAARRAAGAAVAVSRAVVQGQSGLGVSIARPPGHHATSNQALGFCLLNNVALAARSLQHDGLQRVMIVDFDVHHGNGTQDIFYEDPNVLFVSFHQRGIFPGSGRLEERGRGAGEGTNFNVPLPAGVGHQSYLEIARELLPRLAIQFEPEVLLLSAGFDAHWKDPLAGLRLSGRTYFDLGTLFREIAAEHCSDRIVAIQEGGYLAAVLADALHATVRGLTGLEAPPDPMPAPDRSEPETAPLLEQILQQLE